MIRHLLLLIFSLQSFFVSGKTFPGASISSKIFHRPLFSGETKNIIQQITINIDSAAQKSFLNEIIIEAEDLYSKNNIDSFALSDSPSGGTIIAERKFFAGKIRLKVEKELGPGVNQFFISCRVRYNASLDRPVSFRCRYILIDKKIFPVDKEYNKFRVGRIIRKPGDSNAECYRIPGLVTSSRGTLIAVYDVRYNSCKDLPGRIKIGMSRSTNSGETWEPMKLILDLENSDDPNGSGDPSILIDRITGTVWVAALWSHGNNGWNGSKRGLTPDETGQFILVKSDDDGLSWSAPINITTQVKDPSWKLFFQGPGRGISMRNGTLVFPAQFKDSSGTPFSTLIYSKDHGKNWRAGTGAKPNTTESQIVELRRGELMLNMRDNRGEFRAVAITSNLGESWQEHPSTRNELRDPICMASLISIFSANNNLLAFSNPDDYKERKNMTVKLSLDEGLSWKKKDQFLYDERDCFGYSSLSLADKNHLGVLYEGNGELYFIKIGIGELLKKN